MSERPTRHELAYLRACSAIDGIQHACKKPEGFDFDDVVTRLIDAYEATQRPVEPSAHRAEQVAPPAEPLQCTCVLSAEHNEPCPACRVIAPPADDVRERVTHERALEAWSVMLAATYPNQQDGLDRAAKDVHAYVAQQAELERRARELIGNKRLTDKAQLRMLAELLGTEES